MENSVKRVHYYHADAHALGGVIETPIQQHIPVQVPLSLPAVGGHASARVENFHLDGLLSFKSAYTRVAGSVSKKSKGWTTMATSVVEGLNVQEVLTADRIVAQIQTEHPHVGYEPKVTFVGTRFENLRVGGAPINVTLDLELCSQGNAEEYPKKPHMEDERFLNTVAEQYRCINDAKCIPAWMQDKTIPSWVKERHQWDNAKARRDQLGMVPCSLVKEISGEFPGKIFGHALEIAEFGKVFLAELLVDRNSFRLLMVRLELGCSTHGEGAIGAANIEGRTAP